MAGMEEGTISVDDAGVATGTGAALYFYEALSDIETDELPLLDPAVPDADWEGNAASWLIMANSVNLRRKKNWARTARLLAKMVPYLTTNALVEVTVATTDTGLQRDPASAIDTLGPGADKTIAGVLL